MPKIKVSKSNFRDPLFKRPLQIDGLEIMRPYQGHGCNMQHDRYPPAWRALIREHDWKARVLFEQGSTIEEATLELASRRIFDQENYERMISTTMEYKRRDK